MKNFLYALILPLLLSCSSDDNVAEPDVTEGIIKIEVTTTGLEANINQDLNIQVVGSQTEKTNLSGAVWDDIQSPHKSTKWFFSYENKLPAKATYETSNKVSSVTYATVINPSEENSLPVQGTVKFYVDGKLKQTETFTVTNELVNLSLPFVVTK